MQAPAAQPLLPPGDSRQRFVRFQRKTDAGFVEFGFAVGSPDLMADLVLPLDAYLQFCKANQVRYLTRVQEVEMDHDRKKWRFGAPGVND